MSAVEIRLLESMAELEAAEAVFQRAWGGSSVVAPDIGKANIHAGGYYSGAFIEGEMVGASIGLLGRHHGHLSLHSHVTAALVQGVGYELKLHQRSWAQEQGIELITWTFDPLVRRNAVLNLDKLGAIAVEYLPDFYGVMKDTINAGDSSDRVYALWWTNPDDPRGRFAKPSSPGVAVALDAEGGPVKLTTDGSTAELIFLPADIEGLRRARSGLVAAWRAAVREALQPRLDAGWIVTGMLDRAALIVQPPNSMEN